MTEPEDDIEGTMAARRPPPDALPSSKQLLVSTAVAAALASVILLTVVLPAEYGIDPTRIGGLLGLTEMGDMKRDMALTAEAYPPVEPPASGQVAAREDTTTVVLAPHSANEVKLAALRQAEIAYAWSAAGGPVTHNLHVDLPQGALDYRPRAEAEADEGSFVTAFAGWHGWYFHNGGDAEITITLKTEGRYLELATLK